MIAEKLGRHRSTIFRELKRNRFQDEAMPKVTGYYWMVAKAKAAVRRAKERKLIRHAELREQIVCWIRDGWTPEQIAGRLTPASRGRQTAGLPGDDLSVRPFRGGVEGEPVVAPA